MEKEDRQLLEQFGLDPEKYESGEYDKYLKIDITPFVYASGETEKP